MKKRDLKKIVQGILNDSLKNPFEKGNKFDSGVKHVLLILDRDFDLNLNFKLKEKECLNIGEKRYFNFVRKITKENLKTPIELHLSKMAYMKELDFMKFALDLLVEDLKN